MAIFRGSRYQRIKVYGYYNLVTKKTTPTLLLRKIPESLSKLSGRTYKTHVWKGADRIDNLAYNEYGDSSLWWAILDANSKYMTPFDISVGDVIIIPPYESIREALGNG